MRVRVGTPVSVNSVDPHLMKKTADTVRLLPEDALQRAKWPLALRISPQMLQNFTPEADPVL